jgi:hypothetical protein
MTICDHIVGIDWRETFLLCHVCLRVCLRCSLKTLCTLLVLTVLLYSNVKETVVLAVYCCSEGHSSISYLLVVISRQRESLLTESCQEIGEGVPSSFWKRTLGFSTQNKKRSHQKSTAYPSYEWKRTRTPLFGQSDHFYYVGSAKPVISWW